MARVPLILFGGDFWRDVERVREKGGGDQRCEARTHLGGGPKLLADHFRVHRGRQVRAARTAGSSRRAKGVVLSVALA